MASNEQEEFEFRARAEKEAQGKQKASPFDINAQVSKFIPPQSKMLMQGMNFAQQGANKAGEVAAEGLASGVSPKVNAMLPFPFNVSMKGTPGKGLRTSPEVAAGIGTGLQMSPDILTSAIPGGEGGNAVSESAVPWARRALGFQKRFLKTPFARNTANEAGRVALENNVIPRGGSAETMMDRAESLRDSAVKEMDNAFKRAYGYVERPLTRPGSVASSAPASERIGQQLPFSGQKELPFKTNQPAINAPTIKSAGKSGQIPGFNPKSKDVVFEKDAKIIDPNKIIQALHGLRPKFKAGYFKDDHKIIDKAIDTIKGAGSGPMSLEDANTIKSKLQSLVPYGSPGYDLGKSIAFHVRDAIDTSLEDFATKIGDPGLASQFMKAKYNYAAASRMMEGLNNKLAAEEGNMPVSPVSLMMGAAEIAHGNVPGGIATMGGAELMKRRGAGMMARGINSGAKAVAARGPGLVNALLAKLRQMNQQNANTNSQQ